MSDKTWHKRNRERLREYIKKYRKSHPEYVKKQRARDKKNSLMSLYGLTLEEYENKIKTQNNCCAICFKKMIKPQVDHNHVTNKVRDLLCRSCNRALGMFLEDETILNSAILYLRKHKQGPHDPV
jgi:hypothetical protein